MSVFNPLDFQDSAKNLIGYWWKFEGKKCSDTMFSITDALRNEQNHIYQRYRRSVELYENISCQDLDAWRFMSDINIDGPYQDNIIESVVDTIHAEIIGDPTKVQFITFEGDYMAQERAKDLTTFTAGVFKETKVNSNVAPSLCLDALQFGDGWCKVYIDPDINRVRCYRVFPWNIIIDDIEAANCPPTQLFESTYVSRELMMNYYENNKEAQALIKSATAHRFKHRNTIADMLEVREGWYIGTEKNPGRHVIALRNGMLLEEDYRKQYFPFVNLKYKKRSKGFLGKGIPEILEGHQERINTFSEKIDASILANSSFIWAPPGAGIRESHLSNEIMRFIESDVKPEVVNPNSIPPDLLQRESQVTVNAADRVGVNALMMHSEIPAGLAQGSGRQLRVYNNVKSKRFQRFANAYEDFHVELAEMMIDMIHDHVEETSEAYSVNAESEGSLEKLDFRDIMLPKNSFVIRPYPVNFLSETPASRMADVQLLSEIAPEEMKPYIFSLLQNPDIESVTSMLTAQQKSINRILTLLLRRDTQPAEVPPVPFMDLNMAIKMAQTMIVDAQSRGAPDAKVQKLIDWSQMAKRMMDELAMQEAMNGQPPAQPPGQEPQPAPGEQPQLAQQDVGVQLPGQPAQGPSLQ